MTAKGNSSNQAALGCNYKQTVEHNTPSTRAGEVRETNFFGVVEGKSIS
ncbi:hypothetical protein COLAER_02163 [Collinsella aerofaciens ATCC 25986]|uniref:Uncharacterized protein n=1 Tax=Collinsella aerofaciens (strain ATCC 25986 / DSM 3979 / JCM 10188 / KCTC 3647 / NCTC 11838 / VPI 1003) TaxID=411903 RepID=A4ECI0_COLAA|nr:hypothetical protein COLAER_02163 [Collinsella aerofaciens ATCC 25986]